MRVAGTYADLSNGHRNAGCGDGVRSRLRRLSRPLDGRGIERTQQRKEPQIHRAGALSIHQSTFLDISRRHLADEVAGLKEAQILALRSDAALARRAAAAFCREGAKYLKERGLQPTFAHLRLAFLLGPADAARVMQAARQTPVEGLLSRAVVKANPFMRRMSIGDLLDKSARDVSPGKTHAPTDVVAPPAENYSQSFTAKDRKPASTLQRDGA